MRADPRESIQKTREFEALKMKIEFSQAKAERDFKNGIFKQQIRERITLMKNKEKPSDRRFRKSVENKTHYLMRIG